MGSWVQRDDGEHMEHGDICSRISNLDLNNPSDIIWAYKNIKLVSTLSTTEFHSMAKMMMEHRPFDFNSSSIVLDDIGNVIQSHFGGDKEDEEINFVINKCGVEVGRRCTPSSWFVDYLYRLILPFSRICTKQVVDIVAFLFTRTTVAEFDELFEIFQNKRDFLVELNLLKVRLLRERSERYRCKRCMSYSGELINEVGLSIEESIRNMKIGSTDSEDPKPEREMDGTEDLKCDDEQPKGTDFYSIEKDKKDGSRRMEKCPTEGLKHSQEKPFYADTSVPPSTVLMDVLLVRDCSDVDEETSIESGKAHGSGILISAGDQPDGIQVPISDTPKEIAPGSVEGGTESPCNELFPSPPPCICRPGYAQEPMTCLCGASDPSEEKHCLSEAKKCLLDLEKVSPKFFLENAALYLSLSFDEELFTLFKKYTKTEYRSVCASNIFRLKTVKKETIEDMLENMQEARGDVLKAEGLVINHTTFKLYVAWCAATFNSISISSAGEYVEISKLYIRFLRVFQHKYMFNIFQGICACKIERISNMIGGHIVNDLEEIVGILLETSNREQNSFGEVNGEDVLSSSVFATEEMLVGLRQLATSDLCIEKDLESIITKLCRSHRKAFLSQISVLNHFSDEFRCKIVQNLCSDYNTDWRYRRELLHTYKKYPHLFRSEDVLDSFTRDRVFIVRRTAMDMKEENGSTL